jgi:apolipoprotein N-acyltransferase
MLSLQSKSQRALAAISCSLLLWAAWPAAGFAPLLFIAFIPLLFLEDSVLKQKQSGKKVRLFWYNYLTFFLFNILTTWWIWFASPFGMLSAVAANALIMTFVFQLFHISRRKLGDKIAYPALIIFWIAFEYLHMDWDLSWPWLNLGNGFAAWCNMVQWYEYTGTQGGSIWIWMVNILIFKLLISEKEKSTKAIVVIAITIVLPVIFSYIIRYNYKEEQRPVEVVVVQPNIDPYNEKFSGMSSEDQLNRILRLAATLVSNKTQLVVCPETALPDGIWEDRLESDPLITRIYDFMAPFPGIRFLTGLTSYKIYHAGEKLSSTARVFRGSADHFDAYNAGIQLKSGAPFQLHHKSKLVPGVEKMPFPKVFGYLENFAIDLGGITGSLGIQEHPTVFTGDSINAAPVICYESIYGDYVGDYIRQGANLLCIMTNDGWWSNTPGYRQHCQYGRLLAIEHRRSIARSANTGISCFIDQKGDVFQATEWWVPAVIKQKINLNDQQTFYTKHGDYLGKFAFWISLLLLGALLAIRFLKK